MPRQRRRAGCRSLAFVHEAFPASRAERRISCRWTPWSVPDPRSVRGRVPACVRCRQREPRAGPCARGTPQLSTAGSRQRRRDHAGRQQRALTPLRHHRVALAGRRADAGRIISDAVGRLMRWPSPGTPGCPPQRRGSEREGVARRASPAVLPGGRVQPCSPGRARASGQGAVTCATRAPGPACAYPALPGPGIIPDPR
jgi:hypothetical protein